MNAERTACKVRYTLSDHPVCICIQEIKIVNWAKQGILPSFLWHLIVGFNAIIPFFPYGQRARVPHAKWQLLVFCVRKENRNKSWSLGLWQDPSWWGQEWDGHELEILPVEGIIKTQEPLWWGNKRPSPEPVNCGKKHLDSCSPSFVLCTPKNCSSLQAVLC